MLQQHLSDQQFRCLIRYNCIRGLTVTSCDLWRCVRSFCSGSSNSYITILFTNMSLSMEVDTDFRHFTGPLWGETTAQSWILLTMSRQYGTLPVFCRTDSWVAGDKKCRSAHVTSLKLISSAILNNVGWSSKLHSKSCVAKETTIRFVVNTEPRGDTHRAGTVMTEYGRPCLGTQPTLEWGNSIHCIFCLNDETW